MAIINDRDSRVRLLQQIAGFGGGGGEGGGTVDPVARADATQALADASDAQATADAALAAASDLEGYIDSVAASVGNLTGLINLPVNSASLTGDQDDYAPTNWSTHTLFTLTPDAAYDITGVQYTSGGRVVILSNVGAFDITLKHNDTGSAADNRFKFKGGTDRVLLPNEFIMLVHVGAWCEIG